MTADFQQWVIPSGKPIRIAIMLHKQCAIWTWEHVAIHDITRDKVLSTSIKVPNILARHFGRILLHTCVYCTTYVVVV
jgi:hypothetical protein